jgi:type III pantothenate kinase
MLMVLAVDIGNTTMAFGLFDGAGKLRHRFALPTHPLRGATAIARGLRKLPVPQQRALGSAQRALICSVVPHMTVEVKRALAAVTSAPIRVVGRDIRVPLTNRYRYPRQVGQDRLVGAYAAWQTYRTACIVADFGTAITIDVVTRAGEYLGGLIAPGLDMSVEALATRTALLPRIILRQPGELLGRDTVASIRSGVVHGFAALCDGLVGQLKRRYAPNATVVATGGGARLIAPHTHLLDHARPHLVLEGLFRLHVSQITVKGIIFSQGVSFRNHTHHSASLKMFLS